MAVHRLCIQCQPSAYIAIILRLKEFGTVTADLAANILWFEGTLSSDAVERILGVQKAIEFRGPRWSDVLTTRPATVSAPRCGILS